MAVDESTPTLMDNSLKRRKLPPESKHGLPPSHRDNGLMAEGQSPEVERVLAEELSKVRRGHLLVLPWSRCRGCLPTVWANAQNRREDCHRSSAIQGRCRATPRIQNRGRLVSSHSTWSPRGLRHAIPSGARPGSAQRASSRDANPQGQLSYRSAFASSRTDRHCHAPTHDNDFRRLS